jgi:hypothetical protein
MKFKHRVIATIRNAKGKVVKRQKGYNTVTKGDPATENNGLYWFLNRAFDDGSEYDPEDTINKMQLGTGSPGDSGLGNPITAAPGTTLIAFTSGPTFDISTLTAPKIEVSTTWGSSFDALSGVSEVGLFATGSDDILIAHKTFSPTLQKETGGSIEIDWDITMS